MTVREGGTQYPLLLGLELNRALQLSRRSTPQSPILAQAPSTYYPIPGHLHNVSMTPVLLSESFPGRALISGIFWTFEGLLAGEDDGVGG